MTNIWIKEVEGQKVNGNCLQGYTAPLPYSKLAAVLGVPRVSDEYKVSTEWLMTNVRSGYTVSIYDYKETSMYDPDLPSPEEFRANTEKDGYEWHIGAKTKYQADEFLEWLHAQITWTPKADQV
jgi:hypothetical protein